MVAVQAAGLCACGAQLPESTRKPRQWCDDCGSHGARKRTVASRSGGSLDLHIAIDTLQGSLDKLGNAPTTIAWADFKRLHMELTSDLGLVKRTLEQIARRMG